MEKASERLDAEREESADYGLKKQKPRGWLYVSLSEIPLCHARLKLFDLKLHKQRPRKVRHRRISEVRHRRIFARGRGLNGQIRIQGRAVALCHMAKETPAQGETQVREAKLGRP